MNSQLLAWTAVFATATLLVGCSDQVNVPPTLSISSVRQSTVAEAPKSDSDPIAIRIDLERSDESPIIEVDKPFQLVFTNTTDQPVRIPNPQSFYGVCKFSLHFTDLSTNEQFVARRREEEIKSARDKDMPEWAVISKDERGVDFDVVEIPPHTDFSMKVDLRDCVLGLREWTSYPCPNTKTQFSIAAHIEWEAVADAVTRNVWTGKIVSAPVTAFLTAMAWTTPHRYLSEGFSDKAIEMMAADPRLIGSNDDSWWTPLHRAADRGDVAAVRWLLEHGANINEIAPNAVTPLHRATNPEVIRLILEAKPDWTGMWETPLQKAVKEFARKGSPTEKAMWRAAIDAYLNSGVNYDVLTAIYLDDQQRVAAVLKESPEQADNVQDQSPLRLAASLGRVEICRYLLDGFRVDVNDLNRGSGYPIIKEAIQFPVIVKLLIDHGADLQTRINYRGNKLGVWLIEADSTILHEAAHYGPSETVKILIDSGVDIFAKAKGRVQTAMEIAALSGKEENVRAMIEHPRFQAADVELRQAELDHSLPFTVHDLQWLRFMLDHGADPHLKEGDLNLIQLATSHIEPPREDDISELKEIVSLLMGHGVPLDLASAIVIRDLEQVRPLLSQNPESANSQCANGYPVLSFAVAMNDLSIVTALLDSGADVNVRNRSPHHCTLDETPLHRAVSEHHYEMVRLLLDAGADVNARDAHQHTPLRGWGGPTITQLLLERGAKLDARDVDGNTLLDWALEARWDDIAIFEIKTLFQRYATEKGK